MPKVRTTVTLDERVLRAVRAKATRTGQRDSDVIERALRRDLGFDVLDRAWAAPISARTRRCSSRFEAQHEARPC